MNEHSIEQGALRAEPQETNVVETDLDLTSSSIATSHYISDEILESHFRQLLSMQECTVSTLQGLNFQDVRDLVAAIHFDESPVLHSDGQAFYESGNSSNIYNQLIARLGVLPLLDYKNISLSSTGSKYVFAIRANIGNDNDSPLRGDQETMDLLIDSIVPHLSAYLGYDQPISPRDINFVLVNGEDFDLLTESVSSEERRISALKIVDVNYDPMVVVRDILSQAIDLGASDIHIDPYDRHSATVKVRVDGKLLQLDYKLSLKAASQIVNAMKGFADVSDYNSKMASDYEVAFNAGPKVTFTSDRNRLKFKAGSVEDQKAGNSYIPFPKNFEGFTLRGSRVPMNMVPEKADKLTWRLHKPSKLLTIAQLGLNQQTERNLRVEISQPQGLVVITGPTGSGKTTTLYAAINQNNDGTKHIMTAEDPVEQSIVGINQIQVDNKHPDLQMTMNDVLKYMMRSDPDQILVGEVRDRQTASLLIEAAMTGHLVYTTLHTNDAVGAIPRLLRMGVDTQSLNEAANMFSAQRLVRQFRLTRVEGQGSVLDSDFFETYDARERINSNFGREVFTDPVILVRPNQAAVKAAKYNPVSGRMVISEVLTLDDKLREIIDDGGKESAIRNYALSREIDPYRPLLLDGLARVLNFDTGLDELAEAAGSRWGAMSDLVQQEMIAMITAHQQKDS